jgi:type II secretory pathway pseudopilin PulG
MRNIGKHSGKQALRSRAQAAYTLIELAIVMVVAGVMVASGAAAYNLYIRTQQDLTTDNNLSAVVAAFNNYLIQWGSYPCPAPINVTRANANYGKQGDCTNQTVLPGNFDSTTGVYIELGVRLPVPTLPANATPASMGTGTNPLRVRRGMVPFRTLGLPEEVAYDGYGARLNYAVTESLANASSYDSTIGVIDIVNFQKKSLLKADPGETTAGASAHYILFSSGRDHAGAYGREGAQMQPCATAAPATADSENCNTSLTSTTAVYEASEYAEGHVVDVPNVNGDHHFDDHTKYFSSVEEPLWKVSSSSGFHIADLATAQNANKVVGIGETPTSTGAQVQVAGVVHASQDIHASQYCPPPYTTTPTGCFQAGTNLTCPAGFYLMGIDTNTPRCIDVTQLGSGCGPGQLAHGFDAKSGKLLCATVQSCPMANITLCQPPSVLVADIRTLPASLNQTTWTNNGGLNGGYSGDSYWQSWTCNGSGWQQTGSGGACACTPMSGTTTINCDAYYGYGTGTFSGTVSTTSTVTCSPYNSTSSTNTGGCACTATSQTQSVNCGTGYTGGPLQQQRNWTCSGKNNGSWGSWVTTSGTCTCDSSATQTQTLTTCPAGYTGTITQQRNFQCPGGTWGAWTTTSNNCTCTGQTQYQSIGCTAPQTGTQDQSRTLDCSTGTWSAWTTYQNNCGTPVYTWRAVSNPVTGFTSGLTISLGDTCSTVNAQSSCSAPNGSTFNHYDICQCE